MSTDRVNGLRGRNSVKGLHTERQAGFPEQINHRGSFYERGRRVTVKESGLTAEHRPE